LVDTFIRVSQGYGVTTDGDLLTLQIGKNSIANFKFKDYTHYKKFEDNIVNYNPFIVGGVQMNLEELIPENEIPKGDTTYKKINNLRDLSEKVVLLYLENYQEDAELCKKLSCDNQGLVQNANLKVLLVSEEDAVQIINSDALYRKHDWRKTFLTLPDIKTKRVVLNRLNTEDLNDIKQNYLDAIRSNNTIGKLITGFDIINDKFAKNSIANHITGLLDFLSAPTDFQYRYDALKDLTDTYNEIKELLLHINVECCPDIGSFPKHLLLGKLNETAAYKTFRHQFYKSPIVGHEDANYKKVLLLLDRASQIAKKYTINVNEIIITPSQAHGVLDNKAIPFYYNVDNNLLKSWSFNKTNNLSQKLNLSYHKSNLSLEDCIQNPLDYNIDNNNFFRIEGHQGKMHRDALDQILQLKKDKGLNFDVKTLSINASTQTIDVDDYKCEFEELSMLLRAWRTEQNCVLAEMSRFLSGFSTVDAGSNLVAVNSGLQRDFVRAAAGAGATATTNLTEDLSASAKGTIATVNHDFKISDAKLGIIGTDRTTRTTSGSTNHNIKDIDFSNGSFPITSVTGINFGDLKFLKTNIVKDQLTLEENTIGFYMDQAISDNEKGSANDIISSFNQKVSDVKVKDVWLAEQDLSNFIFIDIAETLAHGFVLDKKIPNKLREIETATLETYKLTIDELCNRVKTLQTKYQSRRIKQGSKEILGLVINQMSTVCCSGKKLEVLLEEIEKRKREILVQIQLSQFAEKHPGIEHKAGVISGGTFIMAYLAENLIGQTTYEPVRMVLQFLSQPETNRLVEFRDFELPRALAKKDKKSLRDALIANPQRTSDSGYLQLWNNRVSIGFRFFSPQTTTPNGTINIVRKKSPKTKGKKSNKLSISDLSADMRLGSIDNIVPSRDLGNLRDRFNFLDDFNVDEIQRHQFVPVGDTLEDTVKNLADLFNDNWTRVGVSENAHAVANGDKLIIELIDKRILENENFIRFTNPNIVGRTDEIYFSENIVNQGSLTRRNTIVADFSLPYMCCSNCTPVNFIIPKEPIFLSLPNTHVCLNDTVRIAPLPFIVSPSDGIVKAIVDDGIDGGILLNDDGKYYFNPSQVDESLYGQEIHFTVNDQDTNCKITVYNKLDISISSEILQYNDGRTQATVRYKITGAIPDGTTYLWGFGNNSSSSETPNANGIITRVYDLPVNPSNTISPNLTLSNGICTNDYTIPDVVFEDPINVNLVIVDKVCVDSSSDQPIEVPFTSISPADGIIEFAATAGLVIENNILKITPSAILDYDQEILFTVNGSPTNAKIIIHAKMAVEISQEPTGFSWLGNQLFHAYGFTVNVPVGTNEANLLYEWTTANNVVIGNTKSIEHNFRLDNGSNIFNAFVKVIDENNCSSEQTIEVSIDYPTFTFSMPNDKLDYCINDLQSYPITVNPVISGTVLNGLGVEQNNTGNNVFIPSQSTMISAGSITFDIAGNPLTPAITMHEPAVAQFTTQQVGNKIILTNHSTGNITSYNWIANGNSTVQASSADFTVQLTPDSPTEWIFILEVTTEHCGTSRTDEIQFSAQTCFDDTTQLITQDAANIDPNIDFSRQLRDTILDPTIQLFANVNADITNFLNGSNNALLENMFIALMDRTAIEMIRSNQNVYIFGEVTKLYTAQIRLFYNIINCQSHDKLNTDNRILTNVFDAIRINFSSLKENNIVFNAIDDIKTYLINYAAQNGRLSSIATFINNQLIPLIL
jgi:hypothetical protein